MTSESTTPTDTADISASVLESISISRLLANSVNISASVLEGISSVRLLANSADISADVFAGWTTEPSNDADISATVSVFFEALPLDSWRPLPHPGNNRYLFCRTPQGVHDTDFTQLELWTVREDGVEDQVLLKAAENGYGWDSYGHPEWSPDGNSVVLSAETATESKLIILNSSGFGT